MIADSANRCTAVYVVVDGLYRVVAAPHDRLSGPSSAFRESAVITLSLVVELIGTDEEQFWRYVRHNHLALFPKLPERTRYNWRRCALAEVTNPIPGALQQRVLERLTPPEAAGCVIDSLPVPVVGFHQARRSHRWYGEASYGDVAAKKQTIFGYKLHLLIAHSGLILDFALAPTHQPTVPSPRNSSSTSIGSPPSATRAISTPGGRRSWPGATTWCCWRPGAATSAQLPGALALAVNHVRQIIETVNSQLTGQVQVERHRAQSGSGLCARVQAKLAAHTICPTSTSC